MVGAAAGRARPRRAGRRRAARRRCRCRARPWRSGPTRRRPRWCRARRRARAIDAGAVAVEHARSPRPRRRAPRATTPRRARRPCAPSGARTRVGASAPTRSRSGPCRTASPGSPARSRRRAGARCGSSVLCSAPRQPTAQVWHDVSTVSRSHGRARNRYALAVSAPTGQICTVLPEKYDENGSSG